MEKDYKKIVCEHYGAEVSTDYDKYDADVQYVVLTTADDYNIYQRYDGSSTIFWDSDIFYYAESCEDAIQEDLEDGKRIFIDPEIAEECGFEDDGYQWESYYEKLIEEELAE